MIEVVLAAVTAHAVPPIVTEPVELVTAKSEPVRVRAPPPPVGPRSDEMEVRVGWLRYVNPEERDAVPPAWLTATETDPAVFLAGAVQVSCVWETRVTDVQDAEPPSVTVVPEPKFVPVKVRVVVEVRSPLVGLTEVRVGAASTVYALESVADCASGLIRFTE